MLGPRLKALRKAKDLTQKELADKISVTHVSISGYENGNRTPDTETLQALADFFDVTTDYLLGRSDVMNPRMFENTEITNDEYKNLTPYQKEVVDFFLTRENLQFYDRPERLLDALEQFEVFYEFWKKQQEQKDEE